MKLANAWDAFKALTPLITVTVTEQCQCKSCKQFRLMREATEQARAAREAAREQRA